VHVSFCTPAPDVIIKVKNGGITKKDIISLLFGGGGASSSDELSDDELSFLTGFFLGVTFFATFCATNFLTGSSSEEVSKIVVII